VTTGTLSVKVNNIQAPYFSTGKGVRQGDPLCPFLFNISADTLAKMMNGAQKNKLITSLVPEYVENGIAILQYVDDTILCIQDSKEQTTNLKYLLYLYEIMSGLKINFSKSEVIMISQDTNKTMEYVDTFNCSMGKWLIKYLGVITIVASI